MSMMNHDFGASTRNTKKTPETLAAEAETARLRAAAELAKVPVMPTLGSALNGSGNLDEKYRAQVEQLLKAQQLDPAKFAANQDALIKLKQYAMSDGASPWLKLQLEQQMLGETSARDKAGAESNSAAAAARSALAMRGGLSGGAAERLAQSQGSNLLMARQGIGRAGEEARLKLNISDQQTKMDALSKIPGFDLQIAAQNIDVGKFNAGAMQDADKFNADAANKVGLQNNQNTIGALNQENSNALEMYKQQMAGYGAEQTAKATKSGGKK